jgi:hypothetical protein
MPKRTGWGREFDDPIELPGRSHTFVTLAYQSTGRPMTWEGSASQTAPVLELYSSTNEFS